jgi:hypothetical protein
MTSLVVDYGGEWATIKRNTIREGSNGAHRLCRWAFVHSSHDTSVSASSGFRPGRDAVGDPATAASIRRSAWCHAAGSPRPVETTATSHRQDAGRPGRFRPILLEERVGADSARCATSLTLLLPFHPCPFSREHVFAPGLSPNAVLARAHHSPCHAATAPATGRSLTVGAASWLTIRPDTPPAAPARRRAVTRP